MIRFRPPLPEFPAVPTAPMDLTTQCRLLEALQECKKMLGFQDVQAHVQRGYALIWIHLTLERGLDPRKIQAPTTKGHQDLQGAFLAVASARIRLHDRFSLSGQVPDIAARAARLWTGAKEAQGGARPALLGMDSGGAR